MNAGTKRSFLRPMKGFEPSNGLPVFLPDQTGEDERRADPADLQAPK